MKKTINMTFAVLFIPAVAIACGRLDYWAEKYLNGPKNDKDTMVARMDRCLDHYPYQGIKDDAILYKVFSDALVDESLSDRRRTANLLKSIFHKSNCLIGVKDLENYNHIKGIFGWDCKPKKYLKVISKNGAILREKPSTNSKKILSIGYEEVALFIKNEKKWVKVKMERRNLIGYIHKPLVSEDTMIHNQ